MWLDTQVAGDDCDISVDVRQREHEGWSTIASEVYKARDHGFEAGMCFATQVCIVEGGDIGIRVVAKRHNSDREAALTLVVPLSGQSLEDARATWELYEEEKAAAGTDGGRSAPQTIASRMPEQSGEVRRLVGLLRPANQAAQA